MSFFSKARGRIAAVIGALVRAQPEPTVEYPVTIERPTAPKPGRTKKWKSKTRRGRTHSNTGVRLTVKYPANGSCP